MALLKSESVTVPRKEWDALRKDVQELKEMVSGMAEAMSSVAEGAAALSNSPIGKMFGNMFPDA
jgi:hypothetical protein